MENLNLLGMSVASSRLAPVEGQLGHLPEHFIVEELPLYEPSGSGEHCYFLLEKRNKTTLGAVAEIADYLKIKTIDIGYAGLKDKHALTRQVISIRMTNQEPPEFKLKGCSLKYLGRHLNKIKIGHLKGNRFTLTLVGLEGDYADKLNAKIQHLKENGFPNYFGTQRFGNRLNNHLAGLYVLKKDFKQACFYLVGDSEREMNKQAKEARCYYESGDLQQAFDTFPPYFVNERKILKELLKGEKREKRAYLKCDRKTRELLFNALQSYLFNVYATKKYQRGLHFLKGDVALVAGNLAPFIVEDAAIENMRYEDKEILLSGPLFGYKMIAAKEEGALIEEEVLKDMKMTRDFFAAPSEESKFQGARRPLTTYVEDIQWDPISEDSAKLSFTLPAGSYATVLLQELFHTLQ